MPYGDVGDIDGATNADATFDANRIDYPGGDSLR
ncbi:hypothetical protein B0G38_002109 [Arthrobacter sp. VKM Ac-2550]|nr:hypothetical protein [Arthrobacter sp. VKM Ac-2550]